jgi:hypothetical protein
MNKTIILLPVLFLLFASCSEGPPTGSHDPFFDNTAVVYLKNQDSYDGGNDMFNIEITSAKLLLTNVYLSHGSTTKMISAGPALFNFDFSNYKYFAAGITDTGTFSKIHLTIHKCAVNEEPADRDFKVGNHETQRYSMIIKGNLEGEPFTINYLDDITVEVTLAKMIQITKSQSKITLIYNKRQWFREGGVTYFDPRLPENYNKIAQSILESFKSGFKDNDQDGVPD